MRAGGAAKSAPRTRAARTAANDAPHTVSFSKPRIEPKQDQPTTTVLASGFDFKGGKIHWYPGHMAKASRHIAHGLKASDLVYEIRDARIPFSSANSELEKLCLNKARIIVLNKADLADPKLEKAVLARFASMNLPAVFVSAQHRAPTELLDLGLDVLQKRRTSGRPLPFANMLVMGVPNVGKSTLINALRRAKMGKAGGAKTGPLPGVTRALSGFRVSQNPSAFLLDSPGVMLPRMPDADIALKLGLTGAVKDSLVGVPTMAQYLFFFIHSKFKRDEGYMKAFGLTAPVFSVDELLSQIAERNNLRSGSHLDLDAAAVILLRRYRAGELGRYTLDDV